MSSQNKDFATGPGRGVLVGNTAFAAKVVDVAGRIIEKMFIQVARNAAMVGQSPRSLWYFVSRLKCMLGKCAPAMPRGSNLEERGVFTIFIDWGSRKLACIHLGIQLVA